MAGLYAAGASSPSWSVLPPVGDRGRTYFRDREVLTVELPRTDGFPPFVNTPQTTVERILHAEAAAEPLIDVRFGHRVDRVRQRSGHVVLHTRAGTFEGTHCIAADGAHSTVRHLLGIPFEGHSYDDRFVIADVRVDLGHPEPERRFYFDPPANPGRQVLVHPQPGGVHRIDWQVPAGFTLTPDHVRTMHRAILDKGRSSTTALRCHRLLSVASPSRQYCFRIL